MVVSTATEDAYTGITSDDWSGGGTLFVWMLPQGIMDTIVNGGVMVQVGDGTNRVGYHVGGSDQAGFRHDKGPVNWQCYVLDLANKPANFTVFAGSEGSLNEAAITQVGVGFKTLVKSVGGVENCFWDIIRFADPAEGLVVTAGTVSVPGTLFDVAAADRATGNQQAFGGLRELGTGLYGCQTNLTIGDSGSADSYFEESTTTLAFEDRGLSNANNYYRLTVVGGSGTNSFKFTDSVISVPPNASGILDTSDTNINTCDLSGSTIIGFDEGVITGGSSQLWDDVVFNGNGQVTLGASMLRTEVSGYEGTDGTAATLWNIALDPDGELDNMAFIKGTAATHAIEFGSSTPSTITLTDQTYTGYNAANGNNDSTFYNNTGGALTINIVGGTGNTTYRNGAGASTTINVSVPVTINVTDEAGVGISGVSVRVEEDPSQALISDGTTDSSGVFSFSFTAATPQDVLTIVRLKGWKPANAFGTIAGGSGLTANFTLIPDPVVNLP
jgi:hypothetical protein